MIPGKIKRIAAPLALLILLVGIVFLAFYQGWLVIFRMKNVQVMWPTVQVNDLVLAETLSYRFFQPKAGQMILFHSEGITGLEEKHGVNPPWLYIQRLAAEPRDYIRIESGNLYVNDAEWEPPVWDGRLEAGPFLPEGITLGIPSKCLFVIADHYSISEDSRHWGWVPRENVVARALWVFRADN